MEPKYSIAVDFDGVIHQYTSPWTELEEINDPPMPGAFAWLEEMTQHFKVVIHTCRITPRDNTEAAWKKSHDMVLIIKRWMLEHGLDHMALRKLHFWVDPGKPTALVYIDDRGFRFEGEFPSKNDIHRVLRPWKLQ